MRINFYDTRLDDNGRVVLVKEKGVNYKAEGKRANSPASVAQIMHRILRLDELAEECVYMLALNGACKLLGIFFISKGTVNMCLVTPRELYIRALLSGAAQIILVHNHPSGDVCPSEQDIKVTRQVKQAGEIINIPLVDHIIIGGIGNAAYISLREANML
ncbi:JAB domain-containing protein [bacterium]|nr:JAB domain-containing protein [bacterium]